MALSKFSLVHEVPRAGPSDPRARGALTDTVCAPSLFQVLWSGHHTCCFLFLVSSSPASPSSPWLPWLLTFSHTAAAPGRPMCSPPQDLAFLVRLWVLVVAGGALSLKSCEPSASPAQANAWTSRLFAFGTGVLAFLVHRISRCLLF